MPTTPNLSENAKMKLKDYQVDDDGTHAHFVCDNPGPGQVSDYFVLLKDDEVIQAITLDAVSNLIRQKLQNKFRASMIAPKLDALVDSIWTI